MADIDFGTGPNTPTGDTVSQALAKLQARLDALDNTGPIGNTPTPTPTPAPAFTTLPSFFPGAGTAGETTFTANNGSASNTTSYTRRWLLNGTSIGTGTTIVPQTAGSLALEVTASGQTAPPAVYTTGAVTVATATVTPTPTPTPTLKPLIAVTNQRFPDNQRNVAVDRSIKQRSIHQFGFDTNSFTILLPTVSRDTSEIILNAPINLTKMSVQIGTTVVPVTFDGQRSTTLAHDGVNPWIESDAIPASAFGLGAIARDTIIYPKLILQNNGVASVSLPNGQPVGQYGSEYAEFPVETPPVDDVDGTATSYTGGTTYDLGYPVFVKATPLALGSLSVAHIDDSIGVGFSESWNTSSQRVRSGYGYFNRSLLDGAGVNAVAGMNMTKAGSTMSQWNNSHAWQDRYLDLVNVVGFKHATNDFMNAGTGVTLATMQGRVETLVAAAKARGVQRIVGVTPPPRADGSGDGTPKTAWGPTGDPAAYVQWLRDGAAGQIDALVDFRAIVGVPGDETRWNGGASDYLHPSAFWHVPVGADYRSKLLSLAVDGVAPGTVANPPQNLTGPTVTTDGTPAVGESITTNNGTWSGNPTVFEYRWQDSADESTTPVDISGASSSSYIIAQARQGRIIRSGVRAKNSAGFSDWAYSEYTDIITAPAVPLPVIGTPGSITTDGSPKVGENVTIVAASGVTGADSVTYFLRRNDVNDTTPVVPGPYTLTSGDQVTKLQLRTVATNAGGSTVATSEDVGPVASATGPAPGTVLFNDTFTVATPGTNEKLGAHTSDSGHTWSRHNAVNSGSDSMFVDATNGRTFSSAIPLHFNVEGLTLPSADYDVDFVIDRRSNAANACQVVFRSSKTELTFYYLDFANSTGVWRLIRAVPGTTNKVLGTFNAPATTGTPLEGLARIRGNSMQILIGGVEKLNVTDTDPEAITTAGTIGHKLQSQVTTSTTGATLTQLRVLAA